MTLTKKVHCFLTSLWDRGEHRAACRHRSAGQEGAAQPLPEQQGGCGIGVSRLSSWKACLKTSKAYLFKKTSPSPDSTVLQAKPLTQWTH